MTLTFAACGPIYRASKPEGGVVARVMGTRPYPSLAVGPTYKERAGRASRRLYVVSSERCSARSDTVERAC